MPTTGIAHHQALGIHPGAYVQPSAPSTVGIQDGVLWLDTSAGPPYVLRRWDEGASVWRTVQMDQTGYPLPGGYRLEVSRSISVSNDNQDSGAIVVADDTTETVIAGLDLTLADAVGPITISWHLTTSFTHPPESTTVIFRLRRTDASGAILAHESAGLAPSVQDTSGNRFVWQDTFVDAVPTDKHYVITALNLNDPGVVFYSLTHIFKLESDGPIERVQLVGQDGAVWWMHDGTNSAVLSGGRAVLNLPLPSLAEKPTTIVGQDPGSGLPVWCAAPVQLTPQPAPAVPTAVDPDQFRCGVAQYVAGQMATAYSFAVAKIKQYDSAQLAVIAIGGVLAPIILGLLDLAFPPLMILTPIAISFLMALADFQQTQELLPLGGPAQDKIAQSLYCALQRASDGTYPITGTVLFNWSYNLTHYGAFFVGNQLAEVRLLITVYQIEYWHQLALQSGASGSTLCAGYDCTGLLP